MDELKKNGTVSKFYVDLVNDYCELVDIKANLQEDIRTRGVSVYYCNGGGQEGYKKNDSIAELNKITVTMLKILSELGIKNGLVGSAKVEEHDLL